MNNNYQDSCKAEIKKAEQVAIKKFDKTCEKIAKNEPKVWLTVDEVKTIKDLIWKLQCSQPNAMNADDWFTDWAMNGRIEQAEKKKW